LATLEKNLHTADDLRFLSFGSSSSERTKASSSTRSTRARLVVAVPAGVALLLAAFPYPSLQQTKLGQFKTKDERPDILRRRANSKGRNKGRTTTSRASKDGTRTGEPIEEGADDTARNRHFCQVLKARKFNIAPLPIQTQPLNKQRRQDAVRSLGGTTCCGT
jgi:hypothetical protein